MKKELIFSLIGYVCFLIPAFIMGLWIYLSTRAKPFGFDDVKQEYLSYFPAAIASGTLLCFISIVLAIIGMVAISVANNRITSKPWKGVNTTVIVLLGLLLLMNLWSLM